MTRNMGTSDRVVRLVVGLVLLLVPLLTGFASGAPWLWWAMLAVGAVFVATSLTGVCPAYRVLGIRPVRDA